MALPTGTRLGRYEVRSPLGTGGMGEVYLASDSLLGHYVAKLRHAPDATTLEREWARGRGDTTPVAAEGRQPSCS